MKNLVKYFSVIAIVAVIVFSMVACDNPASPSGGDPALSGTVSISPDSGVTTGTELTASYSGSEAVSFQWNKDGTAINGETSPSYTPASAGDYTVTASASGYQSKTSPAVTVTGTTLNTLDGAISITPNSHVVVGDELSAVYTGDEAVTYQWYKNGAEISGATSGEYTPTEAGTYTVRVSAQGYAGKTSTSVTVGWPTPTAEDFTIGNLTQTVSNITAVTITPIADRSTGAITVYYNGSTTLPTTVGEYTVTFDVAAATGWNPARGLHAGTLTIIEAIQYTITGGGTAFTATRNGVTVGTAGQPINTVINAIRTDAEGEKVAIQFGDGENALDIGTEYAGFNNTGGEWGDILLSGKITSANTTASQGTILVGSEVSVNSTADIANTGEATIDNSRAIWNTGTLTISGGTLSGFRVIQNDNTTSTLEIIGGMVSATPKNRSGTTGVGVLNNGGTVTISGGILETQETGSFPRTVLNDGASPGTVTITGGTISAVLGVAVQNGNEGAGNGIITISGGTVTSTGEGIAARNFAGGTLNISGTAHITSVSTVQATVANWGTGTLNISGGTVDNTHTGLAVRNYSTGKINISGNAVITSKNTEKNGNDGGNVEGTVCIQNSGTATEARLEITGGTISNTSTGIAVYNESTGAVAISGGTISTVSGFAVQSTTTSTTANAGAITLSGNPDITGRIQPAAAGKLSVSGTPTFNPGTRHYTLDYAAYTDNMVAVTGGGNFASNFALHNQPTYTLEANSGNLVVRVPNQNPVAADYTFGNLTQTAGSVTAVTITAMADKSPGAVSNIRYNNATTIPQTAGSYPVTFDVAAATGWNAASGLSAGNLVVNAGNQTPVATDYTISGTGTFTYNGSARAVTVTAQSGKSPGAITISYGTSGATAPTNAGTYTVTFSVAAATGWNPASNLAAGTITITKAAGASVSAPIRSSVTSTSVTLNTVPDPSTGQTVEYGRSASSSTTPTSWQTGPTFSSGLSAGTTYYFFARSRSNNNYDAGTPSSGTPITTSDTTVTTAAIPGVTAPVTEATPVTAITETTQYTGTVSWSPEIAAGGTFAGNTAYTATIRLTAKTGYTFTGVAQNFFTVAGSSSRTNPANSGTVTATFPATGAPLPYEYIITGSGNFTATRSGTTVGTANQAIQTVINAIRTNAGSNNCTIQFGDGTTTLNTSTASPSFNNSSGNWGGITLTGKITSSVTGTTTGTVVVGTGVSVTSTADITNTSTSGNAVYISGNGAMTISGGTVTSSTGSAIRTESTGAVTVSGGTVSTTTGSAVYNNSTGSVSISGGTISATTGLAVRNNSTGSVTVSGTTAQITSANTTSDQGTIFIASSGTATATRLTISGGTVENTSTTGRVIYNASTGSVSVTGGTVRSTTGTADARTIFNNSTGGVTISGGTVSATAGRTLHNNGTGTINISGTGTVSGTGSRTLQNDSTGTVNISGGTVSNTNTAVSAYTIFNNDTGAINISGGTVSATAGRAVVNSASGPITVSGTAQVTSANTTASTDSGTISPYTGKLTISGGTVKNTSTTGNAICHTSGDTTITGGTIEATGFAVLCPSGGTPTPRIILGGNPTITGSIRPRSTGTLSVLRSGTDAFTSTRTYTLDYATLAVGDIAVRDGGVVGSSATLQTRFTLRVNGASATLATNGANLVRQ